MKPLLLLIQVPPPLHGQSLANMGFIELLERNKINYIVRRTNSKLNGFLNILSRAFVLLFNILYVVFRRHSYSNVYISLGANSGKWESTIYTVVASKLGKEVYVHHHTFSHIKSAQKAIHVINKYIARKGVHIFNCNDMSTQFCSTYNFPVNRCTYLSNLSIVNSRNFSNDTNAFQAKEQVVFGHLSNLTFEKGLKIVIETFKECYKSGLADKLIIAGPCKGERESKYLNEQININENIIYLGSVFDDKKEAFYKSISIFLFPSRYHNETQGIVNIEALSFGKLCFAFKQCCIEKTIGDAGLTLDRTSNFTLELANYIRSNRKFINSISSYEKAISQYNKLRIDAKKSEINFISLLK